MASSDLLSKKSAAWIHYYSVLIIENEKTDSELGQLPGDGK